MSIPYQKSLYIQRNSEKVFLFYFLIHNVQAKLHFYQRSSYLKNMNSPDISHRYIDTFNLSCPLLLDLDLSKLPQTITISEVIYGQETETLGDFIKKLDSAHENSRILCLIEEPEHAEIFSVCQNTSFLLLTKKSFEEVRVVYDTIRNQDAPVDIVVAIGGCSLNDVARSAARGGCKLISVPTILSTVCLTSPDGYIWNDHEGPFVFPSPPANQVVILTNLLLSPPESRIQGSSYEYVKKWTSSGLGDLFAEISWAIDQVMRVPHSGRDINIDALKPFADVAFKALQWTNFEFSTYDHENLIQIAKFICEAGENRTTTGIHKIDGEHELYTYLMNMHPDLSWKASHGHLVAIGVLITSWIFSEEHDKNLIHWVTDAYKNLGIPYNLETLAPHHVTLDHLSSAITRMVEDKCQCAIVDYIVEKKLSVKDFLANILERKEFGKEGALILSANEIKPIHLENSHPLLSNQSGEWNNKKFLTPYHPLSICEYPNSELLSSIKIPKVFNLCIKVPESDIKIPSCFSELQHFFEIVSAADSSLYHDSLKRYAYLTFDYNYVQQGSTLRRPGVHCDDFQWGNKHKFPTNRIYTLTSGDPTQYFFYPFDFSSLIEGSDNIHREMMRVITERNIPHFSMNSGSVNFFDGYLVHQSPKVSSKQHRFFARVIFSLYDLSGEGAVNVLLSDGN
jgi:glycerol dehydrogenase-like iron-containing ADH family enzyme